MQETKQVASEIELDYEEDAPADVQVPSEEELVRLNADLEAMSSARTRPLPSPKRSDAKEDNGDDDDEELV